VTRRASEAISKRFDYYSQAVTALGDRPETAVALLYMGITRYGKDPAQALDYFLRAQNVAPSGPLAGPADDLAGHGQAAPEGEAPAAESLYRAALAVEETNSPDAALTMEFLAQFLREQGRVGEAEAMEAFRQRDPQGAGRANCRPNGKQTPKPQKSVMASPRRCFCTRSSQVTLSKRAPPRPRERWCFSW